MAAPPHAAAATRLPGTLGALVGPACNRTYYGYNPYSQLFAWTLAYGVPTRCSG